MKYKIIILMAALFMGSISASPNRCCNGTQCTGKQGTPITTPAKVITMMIDDEELMPIHLFNNY